MSTETKAAISEPVSIQTSWAGEAIRVETDADSGATVEQLTSEPVTSTNIYPEQRFASADGTRVAISRRPFGQPSELWVCDMRSLKLCRVGVGSALGGNAARNAVYFTRQIDQSRWLMKLDLQELTVQAMTSLGDPPPRSGAVSPDERWFIGGPMPVKDNVFRLQRVDLHSGERTFCCELEDLYNPHMQFDTASPHRAIVQINRGGQWRNSSGVRQLSGRMGATLALLDVVADRVTPLPVGRPHTPPISGHECWVGNTGQFLFTAGQYDVSSSAFVTIKTEIDDAERDMPRAAIYILRPGEPNARVLCDDLLYNHIAASDDGRFFIADNHATGIIHVGSIATGRQLPLCNSRTRQGLCQHSHVHAYMTGDNQHVIFNSIATGTAQVHAARVPEEFLERVLSL